MRYFQILVSVAMICYSHSALAIQTTEAQLDELRLTFEKQSLNAILYDSKEQLDKHSKDLSSSQKIWLKHQWLRKLSVLSQLSAEQQLWVQSQLDSEESLTIANPDHPNQQLLIIDIAMQAKANINTLENQSAS